MSMCRDAAEEHVAEVLYFLQHGSGEAKRTFAVVGWMIPAPGGVEEMGFKRFQGPTLMQSQLRGVDYHETVTARSVSEILRGRVVPISAIKGLAHMSHNCGVCQGPGSCIGNVHSMSNRIWQQIS